MLDLPGLVGEPAAFTGLSMHVPDAEEVRQAVALDLATYLMRPEAGVQLTEAELGATFGRVRAMPGLRAALGLGARGG